jgi:hypothetical protein
MLCSLKAQKKQFRVKIFEIQQLWVFGLCLMSFAFKGFKKRNFGLKILKYGIFKLLSFK